MYLIEIFLLKIFWWVIKWLFGIYLKMYRKLKCEF